MTTIGEDRTGLALSSEYSLGGYHCTNGKTTTTALVAAIFKNAGLNAPACAILVMQLVSWQFKILVTVATLTGLLPN